MQTVLNITNGDCAVEIMQLAGLPGDFLPWQDVLHEGPVPGGLSLSALSEVRARYIAEQGWGSQEQIKADFIDRDSKLKRYQDYSKVILWFEHDLYDQLQILQILDWFAGQTLTPGQLIIICTAQYLGMHKPDEISSLFRFEQAITEQHLAVAKTAWKAFRSDTPQAWTDLLQLDTSPLPFLHDAIIRLLEEYPSPENGLSRTQYQALRIVAKDEIKPGRLFAQYQETEQRRFMGDLSFWAILEQMINSNPPMLQLSDGSECVTPSNQEQTVTITSLGMEVLQGQSNRLKFHRFGHWLGGVHFIPENVWVWEASAAQLKRANL